jgi:hypothetical protein
MRRYSSTLRAEGAFGKALPQVISAFSAHRAALLAIFMGFAGQP